MVEPDTFLEIETGTRLAALGYIKQLYQFVQIKQFLFCTGIPS